MSALSSNQVRVPCAGRVLPFFGATEEKPCPNTDLVPARKRFINSADHDVVPVAPYPYICIDCWRAGWRSDLTGVGGSWSAGWDAKDPTCAAAGWRVFLLPGHPQTIRTEVKP